MIDTLVTLEDCDLIDLDTCFEGCTEDDWLLKGTQSYRASEMAMNMDAYYKSISESIIIEKVMEYYKSNPKDSLTKFNDISCDKAGNKSMNSSLPIRRSSRVDLKELNDKRKSYIKDKDIPKENDREYRRERLTQNLDSKRYSIASSAETFVVGQKKKKNQEEHEKKKQKISNEISSNSHEIKRREKVENTPSHDTFNADDSENNKSGDKIISRRRNKLVKRNIRRSTREISNNTTEIPEPKGKTLIRQGTINKGSIKSKTNRLTKNKSFVLTKHEDSISNDSPSRISHADSNQTETLSMNSFHSTETLLIDRPKHGLPIITPNEKSLNLNKFRARRNRLKQGIQVNSKRDSIKRKNSNETYVYDRNERLKDQKAKSARFRPSNNSPVLSKLPPSISGSNTSLASIPMKITNVNPSSSVGANLQKIGNLNSKLNYVPKRCRNIKIKKRETQDAEEMKNVLQEKKIEFKSKRRPTGVVDYEL